MHSMLTPSLRVLIALACLAIVIPFLHLAAPLINSFLLALLIVMAVSPLLYWLRRKRVPAALAFIVTLVVSLLALLLVGGLVILGFSQVREGVAKYALPLGDLTTTLGGWLAYYGVGDIGSAALERVQTADIVSASAGLIRQALDSVSLVFLLLLFVVFLIIEALTFPDKVDRQIELGDPGFLRLYEFSKQIHEYVAITLLTGVIGGILTGVVLLLLGVDFAVLWGLLYFVLSFIPTIGFWLAVIPPLILAWLELGPGQALVVLVWYLLVSFAINNFVKPALMSGDLDLSPLWSVIAIVLWGAILGLPGLILGVPLMIGIRVLLLEGDESTRWLADLMRATVPEGTPANCAPGAKDM